MRRTISLLILIAGLLAVTPHASAGGSWISVDPHDSVGAGVDPSGVGWGGIGATITMRGSFSTGTLGPVSAGTYYAYLYLSEIDDPPVLLGTVSVTPGKHMPFVARTTFRIPDVPTGRHLIRVCTSGCARGIGDLVGGYLWVGRTPQEARLHAVVDGLRSELDGQRRRAEARSAEAVALGEQLEAARGSLEVVTAELDAAQARLDLTASQRDVALQEALDARAQSAEARDETASWRLATYLILIAVAAGSCLLLIRRRRYVRVRIPDSPQELTEPTSRPRERS